MQVILGPRRRRLAEAPIDARFRAGGAPMDNRARRALITSLTCVFLFQTWLVYSDPAGRSTPPLSPLASAGQDVWHSRNCQSCHQIYGFGGFLGPDLTNLASRVPDAGEDAEAVTATLAERFETVLTTGSERMPAFHLTQDERVALARFFYEVDRTGVGQVQVRQEEPPRELFARLVDERLPVDALSEVEARGRAVIIEKGCIDCHLPSAKSTFRAADLTQIHETVGAERLAEVLDSGVPQKGMPDLGLTDEEIAATTAFLARIREVGSEVRAGFEAAERATSGSLMDLPWFEYP